MCIDQTQAFVWLCGCVKSFGAPESPKLGNDKIAASSFLNSQLCDNVTLLLVVINVSCYYSTVVSLLSAFAIQVLANYYARHLSWTR